MCVCMTMLNEAMAFVLRRASIQMKRHTTIIFLLVAALALKVTAADEQGGRCPALKQWGICPTPATKCNEDEDCVGGNEKCCATACGPVCVKALYTGCEQLHMEAERRARALPPSEGSKVRIPVCDSKGEFDSIQCDKSSPKCWCVDAAGFEIPGTRAPAHGLVNCSNPKPCAGHTCRMLCPHGFALDDDGCPLCQCHDPCSEIKCPGSLSCELEDVACVRQPCPPVPRCKRARSLENVCPAGDPLTITGSERPFLCGNTPGKPRCPPMFECFVQRGHDYGVCCPASLKLQKPGTCPAKVDPEEGCGMRCEHDLECPSMQKCCASCSEGNDTMKHCTQPQKVTTCLQMRMLSTLLVMREREGKGYLPQCSPVSGHFEPRQCSRNGLVCWCVDSQGNKIPGSMGPSDSVKCNQMANLRMVSKGRSIAPACDKNICAQVCEYGFKVNENGCPTCECDNPCDGYPCGPGEECVAVQVEDCSGFLCPTYPQCHPKLAYLNPCKAGTPLTDAATGNVFMCNKGDKLSCPDDHICILVAASGHSVCCPQQETEGSVKDGLCPFLNLQSCSNVTVCQNDSNCPGDQKCCFSGQCGGTCTDPAILGRTKIEERPQSMCEYLRDFSDKMEGTQEGMALALLQPKCHPNGSYESKQCAGKECWCVDNFGTEIPKTRAHGTELDCEAVREELGCLDLTCRLGCDYGFILDPETRCPLCECRNPCEEVTCPDGQSCQMVEVNCEDQYCSPVPACLPKKIGQCPYLIPVNSGSCDYECKTDLNCNGTAKCCSNGCGTQCVEPVVLTACQHQRAILEHKAHETGIPARQLYIPQCRPEDGSFEPVQCHPASRQCWCVDKKGNEIPGTRAPPDVQPSCQAPSSCPMRKCQPCEHGYQMDTSGCQTCQCRDPCKEISCRGEGEACRLVKVACVDGPCPPVPMCLPQRDNPCQNGHPLLEKGSMNVMRCGPNTTSCPSSHKCHLSPIGEFAVCCPKPRDVCFEPKDTGTCQSSVARWYFNPEINKCELFEYGGCAGNQNNFESESICNAVCPVLSQCERLREKNQKVAQKYKKVTFSPRCDTETGDWEPIQCLEQVGVCWCVNRFGEPLKGSLTSGVPSTCNFRQARRRMDNEPDFSIEELLKQVAALGIEKPTSVDNISVPTTTRCQAMKERMAGTNSVYAVECDANGRFLPTQCYPRKSEKFPECWCVDEAGNQLPNTTTFRRGAKICLPTPVELVEVRLGFQGRLDGQTERRLVMKLRSLLQRLGAKLRDDLVEIEALPDMIFVCFEVVGGNKVDVAYHLEEMVKAQKLIIETDEVSQLVADITSSRFSHRLSDSTVNEVEERVIALEHREIVSQSTVSVVTPYQTAIIVLSVASAFIICILVVLIALYRKKLGSEVELANSKSADLAQRFLPQTTPIYVVSLPPHINSKSSAVTAGKAETKSSSSEQENTEN